MASTVEFSELAARQEARAADHSGTDEAMSPPPAALEAIRKNRVVLHPTIVDSQSKAVTLADRRIARDHRRHVPRRVERFQYEVELAEGQLVSTSYRARESALCGLTVVDVVQEKSQHAHRRQASRRDPTSRR